MDAELRTFPVRERQMATLYKRIRDAANFDNGCTPAERIAVLELVKAEMVRDVQNAIDDGA